MNLFTTFRRMLNPRYAGLPTTWFRRPLRVLDAGAGPADGLLARAFLAPGSRFEGVNITPLVDGSPERAAFDAYTVADLDQSDLSFAPDSAYDYVVCSHTIEHLCDGLALVPRLAAKVAPGGRLYLEWPAPKSERFPVRGLGLHFRDDATHVRAYTLGAVLDALAGSGLTVEYAGPRRHWLRIALAPALATYHAIRRRELKLYDLWDTTGFALVVRARRVTGDAHVITPAAHSVRRAVAAWPVVGRLAVITAEAVKGARFGWLQRGFAKFEIDRVVLGEPLRLIIADTDADAWYARSSYLVDDWPEMRFARDRVVQPGDVVIDCGAHQGVTALLLARWVGATGRVIGIDPVEHNIEVARQNLSKNRCDNVSLIHAAAGRARGWARISAGTNVQVGLTPLGVRTRVMALDELVDARPTVLKLDVEGAEGDVLAGASRLLDLLPRVMMELHVEALPKFGASVQDVLKPLLDRGYTLWVQWDDHESPGLLSPGDRITHRVHVFGFPPS